MAFLYVGIIISFFDQIREDIVSSCSNEELNRPCVISYYLYRSPLEIGIEWPKMTVIGNPGSRLNRPRTILILRFSLPETVLPKNEVIWSEKNGKSRSGAEWK